MSDKPYDEINPTPPQPQGFDLERELLQRFINLHTTHPHHEIFGEPTKGLLRLPLYSSRPTEQNWAKICRRIALTVSHSMESSFGPSECWLTPARKLHIYKGKVAVKDFQIVRLLAFLADPTSLHWACLVETRTRVFYRPFARLCCGQRERSDGRIAYCVNGLYHGAFATGHENQSGNICTYSQPFTEISPSAPHSPRSRLEHCLLQLFLDLHTSDPNHQIFGEPSPGLVRLPLYSSRSTDQSWAKACRNIALSVVTEMKSSFQLKACWMSRTSKIYIQKTSSRSTVIYQRVNIVRLLAFLANPTPLHWAYLAENGFRARDTPFSHWCNRGTKRNDGQVAFCINGVYHGRFATVEENMSHRYCGNGARPLCPGHGVPPVSCIFTNPDGSLRPCLNQEDKVPKCACVKPCYSISTVSMQRFIVNPSAPHSPQCYLEQHLLQRFIDFHTTDPSHQIFGEPSPGLVRLPLYSSRANEQSWAKVCGNIATRVLKEMKSSFRLQACWMSRSKCIQISKKSKGNTVIYRNIGIVRLLSFLANPTPLHWAHLSENGKQAFETQFSHFCNRGEKRSDGQVAFCVNGLYHGRFETNKENLSHQYCGNSARPLCPGHGAPAVKCIFTHPDGTMKPCLNLEDMVPKCACTKPCF
ncbi:uncharacterized protein V1513DRAFT_26 [Lipomyces chichibuensis]|uniref:uncharacterized protein n=1 Tax=Lipomyces chichibuensis TaxID=1546026 RepID=UPI0033441718